MATAGEDRRNGQLLESLIEACRSGRPLDVSRFGPEGLPAGVLYEVLCGEAPMGSRRVLRIANGPIVGRLDLEGCKSRLAVKILNCQFALPIRLRYAELIEFSLYECTLPGLDAQGAEVRRDLAVAGCETGDQGLTVAGASIDGILRLDGTWIEAEGGSAVRADRVRVADDVICGDGFRAVGEMTFNGAEIGGDLVLDGAVLKNPGAVALNADHVRVGNSVHAARLDATGAVRLGGARIDGQLGLKGAKLRGSGHAALHADALQVGLDAYLDDLDAEGAVYLLGAEVGGELSFRGACIEGGDGMALVADGLTVGAELYCDEQFRTRGGVRLVQAKVAGAVSFTGAVLNGNDRLALAADSLAAGSLHFDGGFSAEGEVRLVATVIADAVTFASARLSNSHADALSADRATVAGTFALEDGVEVEGEVRLLRARLGELEIRNSRLSHPGGVAVAADGLHVAGDLLVGPQVNVTGELRLLGAIVDGKVDVQNVTVTATDGPGLSGAGLRVAQSMTLGAGVRLQAPAVLTGAAVSGALSFAGASLDGVPVALDLRDVRARSLDVRFETRPRGELDLGGAQVGRLLDRMYAGPSPWPACRLRGFRYEALEPAAPVSVKSRVAWLQLDPEFFEPQPFEQLATAYREAGAEDEARAVLIAKQQARRRNALGGAARVWSVFLGASVGYGYRLWLAGIWLLVIATVGSVAFGELFVAAPGADLAPAQGSGKPSPFSPVLYTVDVLIPVLDFGLASRWEPRGAAQWVSAVLTVLGWLLTTAFVGGLATRRR